MTRMDICAAVEEDVALGLNLAGVEEIHIYDPKDDDGPLKEWYREMISSGKGLMILSRRCGSVLSHELFEKRSRGMMLPVVVVMPGKKEDKRATDLIKRAVGLDPSSAIKGMGDER
ncbi:MAG: V-type ATP synthase subunit F [Thermoplasmatota archaeon]